MGQRWFLVLLAVLAAACSSTPETVSLPGSDQSAGNEAAALNLLLARTVNLAGDLELERDSTPMKESPNAAEIAEIAQRGFTAVRIPVDFASWAGLDPPYTIDPVIFERVDEIVAAAESHGLASIIDLHHYEAINNHPDEHVEQLMALWRQIASRYRHLPTETVAFEVLNEPAETLTTERWNPILAEAVGVIRSIDAKRTLIVGPGDYYDVDQLENFQLPNDDNIIATFHYYKPYEFTHQGADFADGADTYMGTRFLRNSVAVDEVRDDFFSASAWAIEHDVPMFVGEFGAIRLARQADRITWTRTVREAAESNRFSWAYWDWAAPNFGLWVNGVWDGEIVDALIQE